MKAIFPIPKTAALILFGVLLVSSCSDSLFTHKGNTKPKEEEKTVEFSETTTMRGLDYESENSEEVIKMPSNALFVQEDINDNLLSYDAEKKVLAFENTDALEEAGIKVGDILYSAPTESLPDGYILKVKEIKKNNGKIEYACEEAYLDEAFKELRTPLIFAPERLTEENFVVFDPLNQEDLNNYDPMSSDTKSLIVDASFLDTVADPDRYSIEFDLKHATIKLVVFDLDNDFKKTKNDQVIIRFDIDYSLGINDSTFEFAVDPFTINLEGKPRFGAKIGLEYTNTLLDKDSKSKKKYLENAMKEKLLGKKFIIGEFDIPMS